MADRQIGMEAGKQKWGCMQTNRGSDLKAGKQQKHRDERDMQAMSKKQCSKKAKRGRLNSCKAGMQLGKSKQ